MKTILTAGIVGVVLFAISASASWYLMNQKEEPKPEVVVEEHGPEEDAGVPPIGKGVEKKEQLPVAVRPDLPLTVDAVLQLSESIRRKELELQAREKAAEKTEQNIKLLFEDLKVERAELNAMMDGLEAKLKLAQNAVLELKQENQAMTTKAQELAKLNQDFEKKNGKGEIADEIQQRVQDTKAWFEGLEDEQAANYLRSFANNGQMDFSARLLKSMDKRKAARILAVLNDPDLVTQLFGSLNPGNKDGTPKDDNVSDRGRDFR